MPMPYKRILVNVPEELLAQVERAVEQEQRKRDEFVWEALRDRVEKQKIQTSVRQYTDKDIATFLKIDQLDGVTARRIKRLLGS